MIWNELMLKINVNCLKKERHYPSFYHDLGGLNTKTFIENRTFF
jgi:hypothetical protein